MLLTDTEHCTIIMQVRYRVLDGGEHMTQPTYTTSIQERVALYVARTKRDRQSIADQMKMPISTFYSKLNGPSEFSFSEGKRLAEIIGCTADEMFIRPT